MAQDRTPLLRRPGSQRKGGRARPAVLPLLLGLLCALAVLGCSANSSSARSIPKGTKPYEHPELWPLSVSSKRFPLLVHYSYDEDLPMARTIVAELDTAWERQIVIQGFTPPPSDEGMCGPDGRFDVFLQHGVNACHVDIISERIVTPWGGRASYMLLDPWGDYGGELLAPTVGHEFNHTTHAANDWHDIEIAFEMTASYVEQFYGPVAPYEARDFQAHPDWSLLWNDNWTTWYMYGSAIYLHFLRDAYFDGSDAFVPELWVRMRNTPDPLVNSPHFVDAVDSLLKPSGRTFMDSVVAFARWRYYAGLRDDGRHFRRLPTFTSQHAFIPEATLAIDQVVLSARTVPVRQAPMLLGSAYLEVKREDASQASFQLSLDTAPDPAVRWVVQAVPGVVPGSDGDRVDLSAGPARVAFDASGKRTLVLTALPSTAFDPNHQTDTRHPVSLRLAP